MDKNKTEKEKMTEAQRKKKIELERELGVPDPPVPNRAHTELSTSNGNSAESSTRDFGKSAFYVNTDRYKSNRANDAKRRVEKE